MWVTRSTAALTALPITGISTMSATYSTSRGVADRPAAPPDRPSRRRQSLLVVRAAQRLLVEHGGVGTLRADPPMLRQLVQPGHVVAFGLEREGQRSTQIAVEARRRVCGLRPPDTLGIGQSTRRTVTIEAEGIADDQLPALSMPPVPKLIASLLHGCTPRPRSPSRSTRPRPSSAVRHCDAPAGFAVVSGRDGPRARATFVPGHSPDDGRGRQPAGDRRCARIPTTDANAVPKSGAAGAHRDAFAATGPTVEALEAELGIAASMSHGTDWPDIVLGLLAG